jgi:hypothetical protein
MTPVIIKKLSTEQLLTLWEMTTDIDDKNIPAIRKWLLCEIQGRNPEGFNSYLKFENPDDRLLRYYITTNRLCLSCRFLGGDCGGITPEAGETCFYYSRKRKKRAAQ